MGFFSKVDGGATRGEIKLSEVLRERGYVYQHSAPIEEIADGPKRTVYLGVDPSADSLHAGNLQAILMLYRFLENGHKAILLVGGGTGMIGDPSGKSEERVLLDDATIAENARKMKAQMQGIFGKFDFRLVNNADWLHRLSLLEFLRDIGKLFSVNAMIARDSVKNRLEKREQGISYTEFSYMLLQAYDFLHLHEVFGCDVQVASSDQWGNIISGIDLIRRKTGKEAYGLTGPLLINKSTGKKFGKSEGGAVWLDPQKTPPFQFYQFWFNTGDEDVEEYLLKMTLVPKRDIDAVMEEQRANPSLRAAQKRLAWEVTALVHGSKEADKAKEASEALFAGKAPADMQSVPGGKLRDVVTGLSTSELRRLVEAGAVSIVGSGRKVRGIDEEVRNETVKIGKNRFIKVE
jgi:tyrosyl-tRNA synthetase